MACVRKRRGKWVVDYRDATGKRRWKTFEKQADAKAHCLEIEKDAKQPIIPTVDPEITLKEYAQRWLGFVKATRKAATWQSYEGNVRLHIEPSLGAIKVRMLQKSQIKQLLVEKSDDNLSRDSVRLVHATLRAMLNAAIDDGIIAHNPADKLGRQLRLAAKPKQRQDKIKALSREQLEDFLKAAAKHEVDHYTLLLCLARTGLRAGEALALQWQDVDLAARELRVSRNLSRGEIGTPKSGHGRTVDMSRQLTAELGKLLLKRKEQTLEKGWGEVPEWVFITSIGTPHDHSNVAKVFKHVLKKAKLPAHFTLHSLRHSYASLLLQQGESIQYVQRQLGHASVSLTVDTYGRWLPLGNKSAVDRLDGEGEMETSAEAIELLETQKKKFAIEGDGSRVVAERPSRRRVAPQLPDFNGGGTRTRTWNQLIKSRSQGEGTDPEGEETP